MPTPMPGAVKPIPENYQWAEIFEPSLPRGYKHGLGLVEDDTTAPWGRKISDIRAEIERVRGGRWRWVVYTSDRPHQGIEPSGHEAKAAADWHIKHFK